MGGERDRRGGKRREVMKGERGGGGRERGKEAREIIFFAASADIPSFNQLLVRVGLKIV